MSNELPWQVWTPDDLAPPPETFVPVEADNVTLTEDTPEPELTAEQQLEQELAQLKIQAHEQGYNAGLAEGRQKGHAQGYQEGLAQGLEQGQAQAQTQQAPIHARMQQLVSEFQNTLDALDSVIASRLASRSCACIRTTYSGWKRCWAPRSVFTDGGYAAIQRCITAGVKSLPMRAIWTPASPLAGKSCVAWRRRECSDDHAPDPLAYRARQL